VTQNPQFIFWSVVYLNYSLLSNHNTHNMSVMCERFESARGQILGRIAERIPQSLWTDRNGRGWFIWVSPYW